MDTIMKQRFALVYQGGIANVFRVKSYSSPRVAERLAQGDYAQCYNMARGLASGGHSVRTFACNVTGDCADRVWSTDLDSAPFSDKFIHINAN